MPSKLVRATLVALLAFPPSAAQAPAFQTPGLPAQTYAEPQAPPGEQGGEEGQTSRFSSVFNPAFAFVIDAQLAYFDLDGGDDGFEAELRSAELGVQSWVDPSAWAYGTVVFEDEETVLEEAAIHYVGLGASTTLRAGRFFVDFGKQMQLHVHELRTFDRPAVLREYLGDELAGTGLQLDHWFAAGDATAVRASLGVFQSLLGEPDEEDGSVPLAFEPELKDVDEFGFAARLTGFSDVGEQGTLQLGLSGRAIPDYGFSFGDASQDGLSNTVAGLDATYGWTDETATRRWTVGAEYLVNAGDNGAEGDDAGTPADPSDDTVTVLDETVSGFYGFADYQWNANNSAGVQYSGLELPSAGEPDLAELDVYYTRLFSEFHRLRIGVTLVDADVGGETLRAAVQYTAFLGAHAHGINW